MSCQCYLTGYLGRDADLFVTNNKIDIVSFSIGSTTGQGEKKITSWYDCKVFGMENSKWLADKAKTLKKGTKVVLSGVMTDEAWTDKKTNEPRSKKVIKVNSFEICQKEEKPHHIGGSDYPTIAAKVSSYVPPDKSGQGYNFDMDSIPF